MKIGILKPTCSITPSGGVKIQAFMWKEGLEKLGHEVILLNLWEAIEWTSFDIILIIEYGGIMRDFVEHMVKINPNIVCAPIIDTNYSPKLFYLTSRYLGFDKLRLTSRYHDLYKVRRDIKLFLVRSEYEARFVIEGLKVSPEKVSIIPLSYRFDGSVVKVKEERENFCLHVSLLADKRKNVERLILAAKKYGFPLKLGGKLRSKAEESWLDKLIGDSPNIEYLGFLSDDQLVSLYKRAKVFALPSIYEGVGMVALEAALFGCDVVLSCLGGPKEYYNNMAFLVDPYNIQDIGQKILKAFSETKQPTLSHYIKESYNIKVCMNKMIQDFKLKLL